MMRLTLKHTCGALLAIAAMLSSLAIAVPAQAAQPQLDAELLDRVKSSTAYLVSTFPDGRDTITGSGFFLNTTGLLLTNGHVIEEYMEYNISHRSQPAKLEVILFTGQDQARIMSANILAWSVDPVTLANGSINHHLDLALLQADNRYPTEYLELGSIDDLVETQQIYAVGFPLGLPEISIREGSISAMRHGGDGELAYIEHTAGLDNGNSGGPLITTDGLVIGINTWTGGIHANTAISTTVISGYLAQAGLRVPTAVGQTKANTSTYGSKVPTTSTVSAAQAYREVLAWALAQGETDPGSYIDAHGPQLDALFARIEKSAYNHGIVPEFGLAVLAAETVYGDGFSWARRSSWDAYFAVSGSEPNYPAAFEDLDTVMGELAQILPELDTLDMVLAFYWCGPDGENLDSLFGFKTAVTKLWNSLEQYASYD